jgi:hypothetical protein
MDFLRKAIGEAEDTGSFTGGDTGPLAKPEALYLLRGGDTGSLVKPEYR